MALDDITFTPQCAKYNGTDQLHLHQLLQHHIQVHQYNNTEPPYTGPSTTTNPAITGPITTTTAGPTTRQQLL